MEPKTLDISSSIKRREAAPVTEETQTEVLLYKSQKDSFYDLLEDGTARADGKEMDFATQEFFTMQAVSLMVREQGGDASQCWSTVLAWKEKAPGKERKNHLISMGMKPARYPVGS